MQPQLFAKTIQNRLIISYRQQNISFKRIIDTLVVRNWETTFNIKLHGS